MCRSVYFCLGWLPDIKAELQDLHIWTAGGIRKWFQAYRLVFISIRPVYLFTHSTLTVNSQAPPRTWLTVFIPDVHIATGRFIGTSSPLPSSCGVTGFCFVFSNYIKNSPTETECLTERESEHELLPATSDVSSLLMRAVCAFIST